MRRSRCWDTQSNDQGALQVTGYERKLRVLVADPDQIARQGIVEMLGQSNRVVIVGQVQVAQQLPEQVVELQANVVLTELRWQQDDNAGIAAIAQIKKVSPETRVVVMTIYQDLIERAEKTGADIVSGKRVSDYRDLIKKAQKAGADTIRGRGISESDLRDIVNNLHSEYEYAERLKKIGLGKPDCRGYFETVYNILDLLLKPDLTRLEMSSRKLDNLEIADIHAHICDNPQALFWSIVKSRYQSERVIFELINVQFPTTRQFNQFVHLLSQETTRFGVQITRQAAGNVIVREALKAYQDHGIIILMLCDKDLVQMLTEARTDPVAVIRGKYTSLTRKIQGDLSHANHTNIDRG